ncbi:MULTISPECIES: response regulator [unclassified Rhizobium]|uniref:response regulator n=1 Tax=unclassified Rhizobium TaxID=2613769 RepID=UPI001FFDFF56|nr:MULTISPECIES: response regulator [unclassified Rhizobium]
MCALILLLEDEEIIAMDVERTLLDAQAGEVVCLTSCSDALQWLAERTPDVAVIDIFLRDGECCKAAEILTQRRVPFVVHSARRRVSSPHHLVFLRGTWLSKPVRPAELTQAVLHHLRRPR